MCTACHKTKFKYMHQSIKCAIENVLQYEIQCGQTVPCIIIKGILLSSYPLKMAVKEKYKKGRFARMPCNQYAKIDQASMSIKSPSTNYVVIKYSHH